MIFMNEVERGLGPGVLYVKVQCGYTLPAPFIWLSLVFVLAARSVVLPFAARNKKVRTRRLSSIFKESSRLSSALSDIIKSPEIIIRGLLSNMSAIKKYVGRILISSCNSAC